jgi:hypothetical protein
LRLVLPLDIRLELGRQALEERRSIEAHAEYLLERWMRRALAHRQKAGLAAPGLVQAPARPADPA